MTRFLPSQLTAAALLSLAALAQPAAAEEIANRPTVGFNAPEGFIPPPLHPAGVTLETRRLARGVYALVSDRPPVDNSGFVVGEKGVLVIDAHINGAMARQIQDAVRRVTDKPILYLVNTNYHGDHTFGNYAFPPSTTVVAHRKTAERMRDFEHEKRFMLQTVKEDAGVFGDARLRLPDVVFERYMRIDLGSRVVELHHFGAGNTPGDTVVYVPAAKVAWTGNLVVGGVVPPIFEGGTGRYLETIANFRRTLDVETIVPGHAVLSTGAELGRYLGYLSELIDSVGTAVREGQSLEETLASLPLGEDYDVPRDSALADLRPLIAGFHRLNVQRTWRELSGR